MTGPPERPAHPVAAVLAAWILSIGFDFFLHGGLLAKVYVTDSPFLLPPIEAFRRIAIGYAAFLILTIALQWLVTRLQVRGARPGLRLGAAAGAVVWGALVLGLYSISTATTSLLAAWWIGQTIELGLAGAVLGAAAAGTPMRRIWTYVISAFVLLVAATIVLQSVGLAPAARAELP